MAPIRHRRSVPRTNPYPTPNTRRVRSSRPSTARRIASILATPVLESISPGSSVAYHAAMRAAGSYGSSGSRGRTMRVSELGSSTRSASRAPSAPRVTRRMINGRYGGLIKRVRGSNKSRSYNYKLATNGVTYTKEEQNVITDAQCVYLGHTTSNYQQFAKYFSHAILKCICKERGIDIVAWSDPAVGYAAVDTFTVAYQTTPISAVTNAVYPVVAADVVSYDALATSLWINLWFPLVNNIANMSNKGILKVYAWQRGTEMTSINLATALIHVTSKASMKMQNRTVTNVTDIEADDVTNCPLQGRIYEGVGSAMYPKEICAFQPPDRVSGYTFFGATTTSLNEPPQPYYFNGVKKSSKISIMPGAIKTSSLYNKNVMGVTRFWRIMAAVYNTASDDYHSVPFGKFRYIALERVIGNIGAEAQPITVGFEHQICLNMMVTHRKSSYSSPIVDNSP